MKNYLIGMKHMAAVSFNTIIAYKESMSAKVTVLILMIFVMCITIINKFCLNQLWPTWPPMNLASSMAKTYYLNESQCSKHSILIQAKKFEELYSKDIWWSACYAKDYIEKLYLADLNIPYRQNKLFFDIGANKGYTIALWLSVWQQNIGINPKTLHIYLSQAVGITDCGSCTDCIDTVMINEHKNDYPNTTLEIHTFEPLKSAYDVLLQVRTSFNISRMHIHQVAISNRTGIAYMKKCSIGAESWALMPAGRDGPNERPFKTKTITLDDFVEQNKIKQQIDLIKIDTEGADPLVLQGAKNLFSQEQIRMLIFENHRVGAWGKTNLLDVIESLNNKGFTCYMLGKTGMIRLTNCWSAVFDVKRWSNILCVHRREERLQRFLDHLCIVNI
jgi:FkbM family methyltransferase